jgi:hypothetical protein
VILQRGYRPPATDATGEVDDGNIDTFEPVGPETWQLTGDWGIAVLRRPDVRLTFEP